MRLLVVSTAYPPHHVGGYELGCRDVVEGLRERGHVVQVLTSSNGPLSWRADNGVWRSLVSSYQAGPPTRLKTVWRISKRELANQVTFRLVCGRFKPDVVYFWNVWKISISMVFAAYDMKLPVVHFSSDVLLSQWQIEDDWYALLRHTPRRRLDRLIWACFRAVSPLSPARTLRLSHVQFASEYLKRRALANDISVQRSEVIHWGVARSWYVPRRDEGGQPTRILFAGRLEPEKGVHVAVEALRYLRDMPGCAGSRLTIAGGNGSPEYAIRVRRLVTDSGLEPYVRFVGFVERQRLAELYREHDIFIFPVVWDEPFSIALLEAMVAGLGVVATLTGGTSEILQDGVNALVFPKENARACAAQVARLMQEPGLLAAIRSCAQATVLQGYTLETMLGQIEQSLERALHASQAVRRRS